MSARLFVAVELPEAVRDELAAFGHAAAAGDDALRAVDAGALHVTLAFLGHRDEGDIEPVARAVRASARAAPDEPWSLALGQALWLAPRRPRVLAFAIEDASGALGVLQAAVVEALGDAVGYEPEHRRFRPHVTVARVRHGARPRSLELRAQPPRSTFPPVAVTLFRSYLGRGPARYEALERVVL